MSLNRPAAVRGGQNRNEVPINRFSEQSGDNNRENASAFGRFGNQPRVGIPSEESWGPPPSGPGSATEEGEGLAADAESTIGEFFRNNYGFRMQNLNDMAQLDLEEQKDARIEELADAFKIALGRVKRTPYYVPSKETRDLQRVVSINEPMQNKIWPTKEIEYYNRKGVIEYNKKNINKLNVEEYNPLIPSLKYSTQTYSTAYAGKEVKTLQPINYYTRYL